MTQTPWWCDHCSSYIPEGHGCHWGGDGSFHPIRAAGSHEPRRTIVCTSQDGSDVLAEVVIHRAVSEKGVDCQAQLAALIEGNLDHLFG